MCGSYIAVKSSIVICLAFAWGGTSQLSWAETVEVTPETLDLGTFHLGRSDRLTGSVEVTNHTGEQLQVEKLRVSCGCLRVVEAFKKIDAGETKAISVRVEPENNASPESTKRLGITLRGDGIYRRTVNVRWKVVHPIVASPARLSFTQMKPGERRVQTLELRPAEASDISRFTIKSVHASYAFVESTIEEGNSIRVQVTLPSEFQAKRESQLVIRCEAVGRALPALRLPLVVARVPREVLVTPRSISLFRPPPKEGKEVTLRLLRRKKQPLEIDSVDVVRVDEELMASDEGSGTHAALRASSSERTAWMRHVDLTIHPTEPGARETVRVLLNRSGDEVVEVSIHHAYQ